MANLEDLIAKLQTHIKSCPVLAGIDDLSVQIERSSHVNFGDLTTNVSLQWAKPLSMNPAQLAQEIVDFLQAQSISEIAKMEVVAPGFINFYFSDGFLNANVAKVIEQGDDFGRGDSLQGQHWVIEHTSPNPNKAMHLGHLRNNLVGMSLAQVLKWSGAKVTTDEVDNNRGIAIAKVMYGFLAIMKKDESLPTEVKTWYENQASWFTPEEKGIGPDVFVTQCYVYAEKASQEDEAAEAQARQLVVDWEAGDKVVWALWEHVLGYAYAGIEKTLARLGSHFDKVWHEHEHYQAGKKYVEEGLAKGVFKRLEDGAVLTNLEADYNLPDTIIQKRDGTSLYITQDIALSALKKKEYQADKLVWVVGPDQTLAMKQVFAVCEQLEIGQLEDFTHVTYGYVGLKADDGGFQKMSSREGTVVLIDDVIDAVKAKIEANESESERAKNLDPELSEKLALAAVKFAILKPDRTQDLTFDINQSVNVQGDSGVYVMYSFVRTASILEKSAQKIWPNQIVNAEIDSGKDLLRALAFFPSVVKRSQVDLSAHHIATYLLEISSTFNSWYGSEVILDGSERETHKLAMVKATGQVLKNGLSLLGITTVDKM